MWHCVGFLISGGFRLLGEGLASLGHVTKAILLTLRDFNRCRQTAKQRQWNSTAIDKPANSDCENDQTFCGQGFNSAVTWRKNHVTLKTNGVGASVKNSSM